MTANQKIRIGFIGAGSICRQRHLPGLAPLADVEIVAVANRTVQSGRKVAAEFNIAHVVDDWRRLLARSDVDAVFIGAQPYMHKEMSMAALEAGKHCFCQARMAMDLAEAEAMAACARRHPNLVNMLCPPPMRMPFEPFIRDLLTRDQLGPITAVQLISVNGSNLDRHTIHWRERVEVSGKQVLAMGIFAEVLNAWVGRYESLTAQTATPIATKKDESGAALAIGIPQVVTIAGRLENGALATEIHSGVATDKTTPLSQLTIWGLKGTLRYEFGDQILLAASGEPLRPVAVPSTLQRGWQVEADFVAAVRLARQGKPPEQRRVSPDFEEGLAYMRKVEAVHVSAVAGHAVPVG